MKLILFCTILLYHLSGLAIYSGTECSKDYSTGVVNIGSIRFDDYFYACSGVLIAPDTVLTVSSCIEKIKQNHEYDKIIVSAHQENNFNKFPQGFEPVFFSTVKNHHFHPHENIALIFLNDALGVKPAVVAEIEDMKKIQMGSSIYMASYGDQYQPSTIRTIFRGLVHQPDITYSQSCLQILISDISNNKIIFLQDYTEKVPSVCDGDEGAPIYYMTKNKHNKDKLVVVGIAQRRADSKYCQKSFHGIRVDILRNWLNEIMKSGCKQKTRVWCDFHSLNFENDDPSEEKNTGNQLNNKNDINKDLTFSSTTKPNVGKVINVQFESISCMSTSNNATYLSLYFIMLMSFAILRMLVRR